MVRGAAVLAAMLLLAACGGAADEPEAGDPKPSESSAAPTAPTAPPVDQEELEQLKALTKLALKAQEAAAAMDVDVTAIPPRDEPVVGADISWPQCPPGMGIRYKETSGQPMPRADAEYVVIGLTNGPGFHANPCLADQVAWAKSNGLLVSAYSVISWPDEAAQAEYGGLQEAGRAQAAFNLQSMKAAGLDSPIIWLDVEQVPHYEWSTDTAANAEVVLGAASGYAEAGYRVGVYSTPYIWESLVGDLSLGVTEWRAAGQTSRAEAESRCGEDWSIQGGDAVLAQWVEDSRDINVTCPGAERRLGELFALAG